MHGLRIVSTAILPVVLLACPFGGKDTPAPTAVVPVVPVVAAGPLIEAVQAKGYAQSAFVNAAVKDIPAVRVTDSAGRPLGGKDVVFRVTEGTGSVSSASVTTNASGIAMTTEWRLGASPGVNTLTATVEGASPVAFAAIARTRPSSAQNWLSGMRVMNHYRREAAWDLYWTKWDSARVADDFRAIREGGFNTVRVIVNSTVPPSEASAHLQQTVRLADRSGLRILITLFDYWGSYDNIQGAKQWADTMLGPLFEDARVALFDLQNEVDSSRPEVTTWLQAIAPYVKSKVGIIPITASVTQKGGRRPWEHIAKYNAVGLPLDVFDAHVSSATGGDAYCQMKQNIAAAGGRTVISSEAGYPTSLLAQRAFGVPANRAATEGMQDLYFRTVFAGARRLNVENPGLWVWTDFDPNATPREFRSNPGELTFGILRLDGSEKYATATLRSINRGEAIDTTFNFGFELADSAGLPLFWRHWLDASRGYFGELARDTLVHRSGNASARIAKATTSGSGTPAFFVIPVVPLEPGSTYTLSAYVRGVGITGSAHVAIAWFGCNGEYLGTNRSMPSLTGSFEWTSISVAAQMPLTAAYAELHLQSENNATGVVWWDDLSFR